MAVLFLLAKIVAWLTVAWLTVIGGFVVILAFGMERMNRVEIEGPRPQ